MSDCLVQSTFDALPKPYYGGEACGSLLTLALSNPGLVHEVCCLVLHKIRNNKRRQRVHRVFWLGLRAACVQNNNVP